MGSIMCKVLPNLLEGYNTFSIAILTILARNRYYAITKPLKVTKQKKCKIYVELLVSACWSIGVEVGDGVKRCQQYYTKEATRCVDNLSLKNAERFNIAVSYFVYIVKVYTSYKYTTSYTLEKLQTPWRQQVRIIPKIKTQQESGKDSIYHGSCV
jgi:hypothetical protein